MSDKLQKDYSTNVGESIIRGAKEALEYAKNLKFIQHDNLKIAQHDNLKVRQTNVFKKTL